MLKRNSSLGDHSALFSELLQLQWCQTCPGLSMKYVTSSAKNTNVEKYFKCLYSSWCITCFLWEGKITILAQITKKWDAEYPEICNYATFPFQGEMSQLRTPTAMHVLRSVLCAVRLCAHTLIATPKCSTKQWALHPGAVGLMITKFGKAGYAHSVQEHKVTLYGAKSTCGVKSAVRTIPTSSYTLRRTCKKLLISLWQNPAPVCFIDKLKDYM